MKKIVLSLLAVLFLMWLSACSSSSGNEDGDIDNNPDGDSETSENDDSTDGDDMPDGDNTPDGDDEAEAELEIEAELEAEVEAEIEPDSEPEVEAEADIEPETEIEPEIEAESELEADAEFEAEIEPEVEPEAELEPQPECACYCDYPGEDFEDGSAGEWNISNPNYNSYVSPAVAANGSSKSLFLQKTGGNGNDGGVSITMDNACASCYVSFWIYAEACPADASKYMNTVRVTDEYGKAAFWFRMWAGNLGFQTPDRGFHQIGACVDDTWFHVELLMDWESATFDAYLGGLLVRDDEPFYNQDAVNIKSMKFAHYSDASVGYIDEVEFMSECMPIDGDADTELACIEEGGSIPIIPNAPGCCSGLTTSSCAAPNEALECIPCDGASICTSCGNSLCGAGENFCNCPADCEEPDSSWSGDDFEDGNYDGWDDLGIDFSAEVNSETAANGSAYSLELGKTVSSAHFQGLSHSFEPLPVCSLSFYTYTEVCSSTTHQNYFVLYGEDNSGIPQQILYFHLGASTYSLWHDNPAGSDNIGSCTDDQWTKFEFVFNWSLHQLDVYMNDVMKLSNIEFEVDVDNASLLKIYNWSLGSVSRYDEFSLFGSCPP